MERNYELRFDIKDDSFSLFVKINEGRIIFPKRLEKVLNISKIPIRIDENGDLVKINATGDGLTFVQEISHSDIEDNNDKLREEYTIRHFEQLIKHYK
jgi:hypothetical protein